MKKKTMKALALVTIMGTVFQFGGCLNAFFRALPGYLLVQGLSDWDALIDIFPDTGGGNLL